MDYKKRFVKAILAGLLGTATLASAEDLESVNMDDLLNISSSIASNKARSLREQPGIVSIITADEIANSGARDLIDILRLVPGFDFAHDVLGHNSWAFRGQWAMEGKIALIVDGRVYNDPAWGNVVFGNRFPVALIEKIEIIRGPGSAKFGGYAELAVVNITTKGASTNGAQVSAAYGQMEESMGRVQLNGLVGKRTDKLYYSAAVFGAQGNQSDDIYTGHLASDYRTWDMSENSPFALYGANLNLGYKNFDSRIIIDNYSYESENLYGGTFGDKTRFTSEHQSKYIGLEYKLNVSDNLTITPKASYLSEVQHKITIDEIDSGATYPTVLGPHYNIPTVRRSLGLHGLYEFNPSTNLIFGHEYIDTSAKSEGFGIDWNTTPAPTYLRGDDEINYHQNSVYAQLENYNPLANVTVGGRWAEHSGAADSVFVPRVALTKVMEPVGLKAMYSKAYRMGDIEHINLSRDVATSTIPIDLKPELTSVLELEVSYALSAQNVLALNLYDMKIEDAIVYASNNTTRNLGTLKSKGAELEWRNQGRWGSNKLNVSHYIGDADSVPAYRANSDDRAYLGIPRTKAAWISHFNLMDTKFSVDPSVVYFTEKYGRDKNASGIETKFDAMALASLFFTYKPSSKLAVSLGVHDLFGSTYKFVQAYDNGIPAQPGPSREIVAKVAYSMPF